MVSTEVNFGRIKGELAGSTYVEDARRDVQELTLNFRDGKQLRIRGTFELEQGEPDPCPCCGK